MASYVKTKKGIRAHICVDGVRKSATFKTKSEAILWAETAKAEMKQKSSHASDDFTPPHLKTAHKHLVISGASKWGSQFSGVYFLIHDNDVVYVGESLNVYSRINTHALDKDKTFTHYYVIFCPPEHRKELEKSYIKDFSPVYNVALNS